MKEAPLESLLTHVSNLGKNRPYLVGECLYLLNISTNHRDHRILNQSHLFSTK